MADPVLDAGHYVWYCRVSTLSRSLMVVSPPHRIWNNTDEPLLSDSVYSVANELLHPFGRSVNALDVDGMSYALTTDVLQTAFLQHPSFTILHDHDLCPSSWSTQLLKPNRKPATDNRMLSMRQRTLLAFKFALTAVPLWQLGLLLVWAVIVFFVSLGITDGFSTSSDCRWFCNLGGLNADVKTLVGVALFLLLGAQVSDAHTRYVRAQTLWLTGINGNVSMLANRLLQAVKPGTFHEGDICRIAGLIAALPATLAASLRHGGRARLKDTLSEMLGEKDVQRVAGANNPLGCLIDCLRSYMFYMETVNATRDGGVGISYEEIFNIYFIIDRIQAAGAECVDILKIFPPFGYRVHITVLLTIWLSILPIGVVTESGWLAVLWSMLIGYGVLGVRRWADELVDPFGCDRSDLPVSQFATEGTDAVRELMGLFPDGSKSIYELADSRPATLYRGTVKQGEDASVGTDANAFVIPKMKP